MRRVLAVLPVLIGLGWGGAAAAGDAGARLVAAYPDFIASADETSILFKDGSSLPLSDGKSGKTPEQLLDAPDIDDMFAYPYRPGPIAAEPSKDEDPGRIRNEAFFNKIYGDCRKGGLGGKLASVAWLPGHGGGHISVTKVNGVADKLAAVSRELEALPADKLKGLMKYLVPSAGGFNCRVIAGTNRVSGHGFGFAIDIGTKYSDYWYWSDPSGKNVRYKNRIPFEIAEIFERHGFVWGAKWYHYDTMHFEYRPELLPAANP